MSFRAYQTRNLSNSENKTLGAFHAESPIAAISEQILRVVSRVFWTANILPDKSCFCEYFLWTNSGDSPLSVSQIKCPHRTVALFNWHEYKSHLTVWLEIMSNKGAHTTRRLFFLVIDLAFHKIEPWFFTVRFPIERKSHNCENNFERDDPKRYLNVTEQEWQILFLSMKSWDGKWKFIEREAAPKTSEERLPTRFWNTSSGKRLCAGRKERM